MPVFPEDYTRLVLEDLEKNQASRKPCKAGLLERWFCKHLSPARMHANPTDEFSWKSIGPNFSIIEEYRKKIGFNETVGLPIFEEPIILEKIKPGGYMLLNGHHRWFAALRSGRKKLYVEIVNLTHEQDVEEMIRRSNNSLCATLDLDEVLLASSNGFPSEPVRSKIKNRVVEERLRKGAPDLIKALQKRGYDVWVYTSDYRSVDNIKAIFNVYGVKLNGIVNATARKHSPDQSMIQNSRQMIREKYEHILHIDNTSVVCTHTKTHSFDDLPMEAGAENWAEKVLEVVDSL